MFISLHYKLAHAGLIVKIEIWKFQSDFNQWKTKIYRIFKNVKKMKQLSENNKLKPIIKKHTFKTKLNKNNIELNIFTVRESFKFNTIYLIFLI